MYDEVAVASSPPPYAAYAAPTPEVRRRSGIMSPSEEIGVLYCSPFLKKQKTLEPVAEKLEMYFYLHQLIWSCDFSFFKNIFY